MKLQLTLFVCLMCLGVFAQNQPSQSGGGTPRTGLSGGNLGTRPSGGSLGTGLSGGALNSVQPTAPSSVITPQTVVVNPATSVISTNAGSQQGPLGQTNNVSNTNAVATATNGPQTFVVQEGSGAAARQAAASSSLNAVDAQQQRQYLESLRDAVFSDQQNSIISPRDGSIITITTQNGIVTLEGSVTSQSEASSIIRDVRSVADVVDVDNRLQVPTTSPR